MDSEKYCMCEGCNDIINSHTPKYWENTIRLTVAIQI